MLFRKSAAAKAAAALFSTAVFGPLANGAVIVNLYEDVAPASTTGTPYTPTPNPAATVFATQTSTPTGIRAGASSSDLLQGRTPLAGFTSATQESSAGVAKWTDGSLSTIYAKSTNVGQDQIDNHAAYGTVTANTTSTDTITYDLGGTYNLSEVNVYQGWNDSGRDSFTFTLLASADNVTYTPIATFTKLTPDNTNTNKKTTPVTNQVNIVDDGGAFIASNFRYLRMNAIDADNGYAGMVEFDAFGTATPEPTSLGLLGIVGIAALRRRRR
jgi:hypothetical protein